MRRSNSPTIRMFGAFCCSLFSTFHNLTRLSDAPLCHLMFFLALQFTFKRFRDNNKNKSRYPCHHVLHPLLFRPFFASKFHFFLSHLVTFATLLSSFLSYLIEGFFVATSCLTFRGIDDMYTVAACQMLLSLFSIFFVQPYSNLWGNPPQMKENTCKHANNPAVLFLTCCTAI